MKKTIITGLMVLASMIGSTSFAQDIYKTAANVPMVQLNNGILMPQFGLGTFLQPSDSVCEQSCLTALKAGYRHIDTAHAYNDEAGVGRAVKESGIPREEIWITSKLWPTEYGEGKTLKAIDEMLERMQLDYIDLLYVHQPVGDFVGAWRDMEKAKAHNIQVECWFPLGGAMSNGALLKDPTIMEIAKAHGKTAAQVILRWHIQEGFSVIPGASNPDYIKENIDIFDFTLTDDEMAEMRGLNKERRFFNMSFSDVERMVEL